MKTHETRKKKQTQTKQTMNWTIQTTLVKLLMTARERRVRRESDFRPFSQFGLLLQNNCMLNNNKHAKVVRNGNGAYQRQLRRQRPPTPAT